MSGFNNRIIDARTHGRSRTYLVRTQAGNRPPEPITCFASYKVNNRPLIERHPPSSDESRRQIRLHFTYSRNNGPIQRVMIDDNAEDWNAANLSYSKLDSDLCRAQDGESLAFYLLSDGMGVMEQVIPDLNDIHQPPILLPPAEATRMVRSRVPESPTYDYTITGISGDGLIPIKGVFNVDARKIAIPHPVSSIDLGGEVSSYPRWYPSNNIVKEDNTIVIYPTDNVDEYDFDLFKALGGVGDTPITINSCAKAVPRKYICEASHVFGSQVSSLMPARLTLNRSDANVDGIREPVRFSEPPFPFKAAGWRGDTTSWPPLMNDESSTRGADWIASYRRNDGPLKVITWNTGSREPGTHHGVWDAIKELLLDDYGRTAFMLSDFNSTASSYNGDGGIAIKSGIGSNLNFTTKAPEEGEPIYRSNQPYRYSGKSVEVRDKQIQFSDESAGAVWNENTITIYPTDYRVANEYGFDGYSDYYEYLCQYVDQQEAGEPITVHSCAAVEPADHIQVNTKITLNSPEVEVDVEVPRRMGQGLSAAIKLNDGIVKHFKFEAHELESGLNTILTYLYFMGKTPEVTIAQGDGTAIKVNDLYFRSNFTAKFSEISGCSGTERSQELWMPIGNRTDFEDPSAMPMVSILDTPEPFKRESNSATFIKHPVTGYIDLFDLIKYTKGNEHTIYSSAVVPSVIWDKPIDGGGLDDPEEIDYTPLVFSTSADVSSGNELTLKMSLVNTQHDWVLYDDETNDLAASRMTNPGFTGETTTLTLGNPGATYRRYRLEGEVKDFQLRTVDDIQESGSITVESFSDRISEYKYNVPEIGLTVPTQLPSHVTNIDNMFENCTIFDQDISGWDTSRVTSMKETFKGCNGFNQDISAWDVSKVTTMESAFAECTSFNQDISKWNTLSLTNLSHTFAGCSSFNSPLNNWNVSQVTKLDRTFAGATSFNQPLSNWNVGMTYTLRECFAGAVNFNQDISAWNVERVEDMQYTFAGASSFNQDLSVWDTASLLNLEGTFKDAVLFNSDLSLWNTSQAVTLSSTFQGATSFNQPLNDWNVSKVSTMQSTFSGATAFNQPLNDWDVSNVSGSFPMYGMFEGATLFNQDLSSWCVPDVEYINKFDEGAVSWSEPRPPWGYCGLQVVSSLQFTITTGDVAPDKDRLTIGFPEGMPGTFKILRDGVLTNTSPDGYDSDIMNQYGNIAIYVPPNTTRTFTLQASAPVAQLKYYTDNTKSTNKIAIDAFSDNILRYEFSIQNADLTVPQTLPVHITSMFAMFKDSNRFNQDLSGWDVSRITNATDAFRDCVAFNGDVGTWRLDKLGNAQRMFKGCKVFNQPLNDWRFPELRVAIEMFSGCSAFNQDLNSWNVSGIRDFEGMFSGCTVFNGTITDWDMTGAAVLHKMFYNCRAFNQPIGNWNVASVSNFDGMFSYAISFNQDISTWDMSGVKNVNGLANMFAQATGFNQDLSTWNVLKVPSRPYEFDSGLTATWTLPRPKWGTDGKPITVPPIVPYDSNSFNVLIEQTETQSPTIVNITLNLNQDASDWEVWIGNEMIASPQYAKAPVTVSNNTITIPNSNNRTQIAVKGSMSTVALLMASPVAYTSLGKITTSVINYSPTINSYRFTVKESALTVPDTLPGHITSLSEMFKGCTNILSDISGWDTSNIMYATSMLNGATNFNQDLSGWNVVNIKSKPTSFDDYCNSWTLPRPIWGSDGSKVELPNYTPMEFNVTTTDAEHYSEGLSFEVHGLESDYFILIDDVTRVDAETSHPSVSITNYGSYSAIKINNIGVNKVVNYKFYTKGSLFNIVSMNPGSIANVDMVSFSDHISKYTLYMNDTPFKAPAVLPKHITSLDNMFSGNVFDQDLSGWDTSHVTSMVETFKGCNAFNSPLDTWDVSDVTTMKGMFNECKVFNQPLNSWDVSSVLNMNEMFISAHAFDQPLNNWKVDKVTTMREMFKYAYVFNQDISMWNMTGVTDISEMFYQAMKFNQPLNAWNVSDVTNMSGLFSIALVFDQPLDTWNTNNVTNMSTMFSEAIVFNQPLDTWNTSKVTNMSGMFNEARAFNQDLSSWDVSLIPELPNQFYDKVDEWTLPKPVWGTSGKTTAEPVATNFRFEVDNTMNAEQRVLDINLHSSDFCTILRNGEAIYVSSPIGDPSEITMSNTWPDRTISIIVPPNTKNTYEVTNPTVKKMVLSVNTFNNLEADINVLSFSADIPHYQFNVEAWPLTVPNSIPSTVKSAYMMFWNARNFNSDISAWDVSNITDMSYMFYGTAKFNQDLSTWNTTAILEEPAGFAVNAESWTLPRPTWGPTVDCNGATENVKLNVSGGVSNLRYKVEINGHVFNEDGAVDISTGWHDVASELYFMCEDNGDNTLTMTVYEDNGGNTLPVKLTPLSDLTTATITGGDTVANPTIKYDEGTSSISFCVITEDAA